MRIKSIIMIIGLLAPFYESQCSEAIKGLEQKYRCVDPKGRPFICNTFSQGYEILSITSPPQTLILRTVQKSKIPDLTFPNEEFDQAQRLKDKSLIVDPVSESATPNDKFGFISVTSYHGNSFQLVLNRKGFYIKQTFGNKLKILYDIAQMVRKLHKEGLVHGHLGFDSIVAEPQYHNLWLMRFLDFANARPEGESIFTFGSNDCGFKNYLFVDPRFVVSEGETPEGKKVHFDKAVDIYHLGVMLYILLRGGRAPFQTSMTATDLDVCKRVFKGDYPIKKGAHIAHVLLYQMLSKNANVRPTVEQFIDWIIFLGRKAIREDGFRVELTEKRDKSGVAEYFETFVIDSFNHAVNIKDNILEHLQIKDKYQHNHFFSLEESGLLDKEDPGLKKFLEDKKKSDPNFYETFGRISRTFTLADEYEKLNTGWEKLKKSAADSIISSVKSLKDKFGRKTSFRLRI